ncbi:tetratricopeptide repeat protein [Marinoscillum sp.]|uniref:tetratricopeptide repeat protein n=1 Tax=Marinoscillum sp. TaxID=2024838 RepID=UPI003BAA1F64
MDNQNHEELKSSLHQIKISRVLLYLIVFLTLSYITNDSWPNSNFYRYIHLKTETLIGIGTLSYIIELIVFALFFLTIKEVRRNLISLSSGLVPALAILFLSIFLVTIIEYPFIDQVTVSKIFTENSLRTGFQNLWYILLIGLTEELIFKFLFLNQILVRIKPSNSLRRVAYLALAVFFALIHIPELLNKDKLHFITIFFPLLYSFLSSILYLRYRSLPLLVVLHILLDVPIVFVENGNASYLLIGLIIISLLLSKRAVEYLLRKVESLKVKRMGIGLIAIVLLMSIGTAFTDRTQLDFHNLSKELKRLGDYDTALEFANKSLIGSKNKSEYFNHRGTIHHWNGNYQLAFFDYDSAISLKKDYYKAIRNRGLVARNIGSYEQCMEDLTIAIEQSLVSSEVLLDRGTCEMQLGQITQAITDFKEALLLDSLDKQIYYELGRAYLKLGNLDTALLQMKRSIEIDNEFAEAYEIAALAHSGLKNYDSSNICLKRVFELKSDSKIGDYLYGLNYYHLEDYESSVKHFEKSLILDPDRADIYYDISNAYYALNNLDKTCESLIKAAELGHELALEELQEYCGTGP